MELTLVEIVERLGGEARGDAATRVSCIATLENAKPGAIAFLANPKYQKQLALTRASAVILAESAAAQSPVPCIVTPQPYLYFAHLAQWLNPMVRPPLGLHASATSESVIPPSVSIGPGARIGKDVRLGQNVVVGANCLIGDGTEIGDDSLLYAGCVLYAYTRIGMRAIVHSGAVIGADGFGFAREQDGAWVKIPQTGRVWVGDDVEIGANTCIDRGAIDDTIIEDGVKLDNQIQVAHNVRIGAHTAVAGCTGIAGSAVIGKRCMIAGACNIIGHIEIADDVTVLVASTISRSIAKPGTYSGTVPSQSYAEWRRNYAHLRHLDGMADKIRRLETRIADLEKK